MGIVFIAVGVFTFIVAILDLEFFMNFRKARNLSRLITRNGARLLYTIIGIGLIALGILAVTGVIDLQS